MLWGIYPVKMLNYIVTLCLNFFSNCHTLFHRDYEKIYIPTSSVQGFQFLHTLANTCYFYLFIFSIMMLDSILL